MVRIVESYLPAYSQTGKDMPRIKGIVEHWVANPNSKAINNINYWKSLASGIQAHEVIDLDGTIHLAVPKNRMCYQVGSKTYTRDALTRLSTYPNNCVYGLEWTHTDWDGTPTDATYESGVLRTAELMKEFGLTIDDIWLHWEVVGWKDCHRWFVNSISKRWKQFLDDVQAAAEGDSPFPSRDRKEVIYDDLLIVEDLGKGDRGLAVNELQRLLQKLGFDPQGVDGIFGKNTEAAVMSFQKSRGIVVDGIVGINTRAELEEALDELEGPKTWYRVRRDPVDSKTQLIALRDKDDAIAYAKEHQAYALEDLKVIYSPRSEKVIDTTPKTYPDLEKNIGKRLEAIVDGVNFYSVPSWERADVVAQLNKGVGFPEIIGVVDVEGSPAYKVENSKGAVFYLTARADLVKVEAQTPPAPPASKYPELEKNIGKRVEAKAASVPFRTVPTWNQNDIAGYIQRGIGFPTIVAVVDVSGSPAYKVKNSSGNVFYITARTDLVTVVNTYTPAPPTPAETYNLPNKVISRTTRNSLADVRNVQRALNALYFNCGKVDGVYGYATADAVRRFQSMNRALKDDGIYGPATRTYMLRALSK